MNSCENDINYYQESYEEYHNDLIVIKPIQEIKEEFKQYCVNTESFYNLGLLFYSDYDYENMLKYIILCFENNDSRPNEILSEYFSNNLKYYNWISSLNNNNNNTIIQNIINQLIIDEEVIIYFNKINICAIKKDNIVNILSFLIAQILIFI